MSENKLLKDINREIKLISLEKSEKNNSKNDESKNDILTVEEKEVNDNDESTILSTDDSVEELAKEKIDDIKDDVSTDVLSSDPSLLNDEDKPVERNEIDDIDSADGVLNRPKQDITSKFIDPDSKEENDSKLKVVDTSLGIFTVLNYDENSVLLLDCNKQKIQISLEDFNNLHPFEIRDEQLSTINDFKSAYNKDLSDEEELKNSSEDENSEDNQDQDSFENSEDEEEDYSDEEDLSDDLSNFGESVIKEVVKDNEDIKKENNVLSEIQKQLSRKRGVSETIRSDVRSKNRCVLVARKTKTTKDKDICMNETKPKNKSLKTKAYESKKIIKKEATQPSGIYVSPKSLSSKNKEDNFDITKVMTIKDGKYIFVKLEGKSKIAYLKLKPRKDLLSINELNLFLKERNSFFESLNFVCNDFYILEKEIVMKRFRKYESEDVENVENDFDDVEELDDVESEDEEFEEDDVESLEEDDLEEEDSEKEEDSISFSTEINGVRYSGTLYRDDSSEDEDEVTEENEEETDDEEAEDEVDDDQEDDDLILQSEEELDSLDFPEGLDESVIKAKARIYGKRYNVSFCDVKRESVKRAKIELRRHNIVEAWNSLVRGAKYIKC